MSEESENKDGEVLSQDEIDTLLTGVDEGEVETDTEVMDGEPRPFDFSDQDKIVRGQLPTLEMINERFSRFYRNTLKSLLQRNTSVTPSGIRVEKYADYAASLNIPSSMNWVDFSPLNGKGIILLDATLVFKYVDMFFGGSGKVSSLSNREFTLTEQRVCNRVIEAGFDDIALAWQSVVQFDLKLAGHESNPLLTNNISPTEVVITSTFEIDLDGETGEMHIVMPLSMIEPIKEALDAGIQSDVDKTDDRWTNVLTQELMHAPVSLDCKVVEKQIALRDILDLQEGDVISVDLPETVTIMANRLPVYKAKLGVSGDRLAVQIVDRTSEH